jgi:hypothetical protein
VTLAEMLERELGCAFEERALLGTTMLVPTDGKLGAFGIIVGERPTGVFRVRSYGDRVHLVLWGAANEKKLDKALRKLIR